MKNFPLYILFAICLAALPLSLSHGADCFDLSTLSSSSVICTYGSYTNPYQFTGIANGRHTVMSNPGAYDPNVPSLRTIPEGEQYSIRLGNDHTGAQAESVTFLHQVDPTSPILLLRYAAVMEDPNHQVANQPRLKLDVMNEQGDAVDALCTSLDFTASASLGWNSLYRGSLLWKDWTYVGVDLSAYAGQTIRIRLTTFDCSQGGHYGYAYIHLSCMGDRIQAGACRNDANVTFSAPPGFSYSWYTYSGATKVPQGTTQTITVPSDGQEYFCDIAQVGKPDCSYTTSVRALPRFPVADFTIDQRLGCADTLYLTNLSGVSADGVTKNFPLEAVDEVRWDLGDGRVLTDYDPQHTPLTYEHAGTYTITLTAIMRDGGCTSTMSQAVTVRGTNDPHVGHIAANICEGSYYPFDGQRLTTTGTYYRHTPTARGCDSTTVLYLTVNPVMRMVDTTWLCRGESLDFRGYTVTRPGTYTSRHTSSLGCDSNYTLVVLNAPTYYREETATICDNETYDFYGRTISEPGVYYDSLLTIHGCDSVIRLTLNVLPTYRIDRYVETCQNDTFTFRGRVITEPGIFYDSLLTTTGCDSVYRFVYNVTPIFRFDAEATICQGESYTFQGQQFADSGLHVITYPTVSGCDSVYRLLLHVKPRYLFEETASTCDTDPYTWRGHTYYASGVYYDSLRTVAGYDSIYRLTLTVHPSYLIPAQVSTCEGETFSFRGRTLTEPGVYYDTLLTVHGCDSVFRLVYNVLPAYHFYDTAYVCHGSVYEFRGRTLTHPGSYADTLQSISGCDSVYHLRLYQHPTYLTRDSATICEGESVQWLGRTLDRSGVYCDTLHTIHGCDSIFIFSLRVLPVSLHNVYINLCPSESFTIRGNACYAPSICFDTLLSSVGCDSIIRYVLAENPDYIINKEATICPGSYYDFRGRNVYLPGVYNDTLRSLQGCDSIYRLTLRNYATFDSLLVDTIRCGEPYRWRGRMLTEAGDYVDSLKASTGCDSVYRLQLYRHPSYTLYDTATICRNESFMWFGRELTLPGVYTEVLPTIHGCDSTIVLTLSVVPAYFEYRQIMLCPNETFTMKGVSYPAPATCYDTILSSSGCDSVICYLIVENPDYIIEKEVTVCAGTAYEWRGQTYTHPGVYNDTLRTLQGCDSIYRLTLSEYPRFVDLTIDTVRCSDEPYRWRGRRLTESGIYVDSLTSIYGCDSIYVLELQVNRPYYFSTVEAISSEHPYQWRGRFFDQTGIYTDSFVTRAGCDSIYELNLTVVHTTRDTLYHTLCYGESYAFAGQRLSTSGIYADTLFAQTSIPEHITVLYLEVVVPNEVYYSKIEDVCADDQAMDIVVRFSGPTPERYSLFFDDGAHRQGFGDVLDAEYTGDITVQVPFYSNRRYIRPDHYSVRVRLNHSACAAAETEVEIPFLVRYPSWIIEQNWNDVIALLNADLNGGYTFSRYEWRVNGRKVEFASGSYLYMQEISEGDEVVLCPTREGENYSIPTCPLIVEDKRGDEVTDAPVLVYPSAAPAAAPRAFIRAEKQGRYLVHTAYGGLVTSGECSADAVSEITLPAMPGLYLVTYLPAASDASADAVNYVGASTHRVMVY